jgi:hypothetical protein
MEKPVFSTKISYLPPPRNGRELIIRKSTVACIPTGKFELYPTDLYSDWDNSFITRYCHGDVFDILVQHTNFVDRVKKWDLIAALIDQNNADGLRYGVSERWLFEELKGYVDGRHCSSIMEEIQQVDRGIKILEYAIHLLKAIGDKKNHQSQITEYEISDVLDALMIYLGFDTEENVEGRIYSKDGTLRIDSSGVHDLVKDLRRIHEQYEKRYQADYSGQRKEHLIFTFGIRDIRSIEEKFSDEYIVARADSCFADIIAINCDAVFADPSAITDEEFRQMNEVFQYGSPIVIFSQKPWYRLNFKYYLVDLSAEFDMEWLDKIRMKHIQSEKI